MLLPFLVARLHLELIAACMRYVALHYMNSRPFGRTYWLSHLYLTLVTLSIVWSLGTFIRLLLIIY